MSVEAALKFIRRARTEHVIRAALLQASTAPSVRAICAIGADHALEFSPGEFDRALKIEWAARWAHFGNPRCMAEIELKDSMHE